MFQIGEKVKDAKNSKRGNAMIGEGEIIARYHVQTRTGIQYGYEICDERGYTHHRGEKQIVTAEANYE